MLTTACITAACLVSTPAVPGLFPREISVTGYTSKDVKELKDKVHAIMEKKLLEYKAAWIVEEKTATNDK